MLFFLFFFFFKQFGLFTGIYGLTETTLWRPPMWTVTASGCPFSTQTLVRIQTRALGDPKVPRAQVESLIKLQLPIWVAHVPRENGFHNFTSFCYRFEICTGFILLLILQVLGIIQIIMNFYISGGRVVLWHYPVCLTMWHSSFWWWACAILFPQDKM